MLKMFFRFFLRSIFAPIFLYNVIYTIKNIIIWQITDDIAAPYIFISYIGINAEFITVFITAPTKTPIDGVITSPDSLKSTSYCVA